VGLLAMELIYALYAGTTPRYILFLCVGNRNNKVIGFDTIEINDADRTKILNHHQSISSMSIDKTVSWLKTHCPTAYRKGYKEISIAKFTVISRYPITNLK
jgi:hypothetical protein